jgi:hypothetical protein
VKLSRQVNWAGFEEHLGQPHNPCNGALGVSYEVDGGAALFEVSA